MHVCEVLSFEMGVMLSMINIQRTKIEPRYAVVMQYKFSIGFKLVNKVRSKHFYPYFSLPNLPVLDRWPS